MSVFYKIINFIIIAVVAIISFNVLGAIGSLISIVVGLCLLFATIYNHISLRTFGIIVGIYIAFGLLGTLFGWAIYIGIAGVLSYGSYKFITQ